MRMVELDSERASSCAVMCCANVLSLGGSTYNRSSSRVVEALISSASTEGRVVLFVKLALVSRIRSMRRRLAWIPLVIVSALRGAHRRGGTVHS